MAITKASDLAKLLADGVVGTTEIGDGQITTAKIADSAITTDKLASNAVTAAQLSVSGNDIPYDNSVSGMSANTLQEAIDYLNVVTGGGSAGAQATYTRDAFTATEGQTTFTTSNGYTLGYVQVFMNGVLLALTDYVANDESTVVLSVGASAGDEIVIVAYDSFAISEVLRVLNISASAPDDGVTVTAGGDLLIGKTSGPNYNAVGVDITAVGEGQFTGDTRPVLQLNRLNSDGDHIVFRRDGNPIGFIGHDSADNFKIGASSGGGAGLYMWGGGGVDPIIQPLKEGSTSDGECDLGRNSARFRHLYLSGGVYLGGTDSSNLLDDYEEGTWTPYIFDGADNQASNMYAWGLYTRIGNMVHATFNLSNIDMTGLSPTSYLQVQLPFTAKSYNTLYFQGSMAANYLDGGGRQISLWIPDNNSYLRFRQYNNNASGAGAYLYCDAVRYDSAATDIWGSISYQIA